MGQSSVCDGGGCIDNGIFLIGREGANILSQIEGMFVTFVKSS